MSRKSVREPGNSAYTGTAASRRFPANRGAKLAPSTTGSPAGAATPYIPFKVNSRPEHTHGDSLWAKTYHYFSLYRQEFMDHYHKRSNVETAFSMINAKFGGSLRSKNPEAQVNDALNQR